MRLNHLCCLIALATCVCMNGGCAKDPYLGLDPQQKILAQSRDAAGGVGAFEACRFIVFDFVEKRDGREVTRRIHDWDRRTGVYSIQWRDAARNETYKVQFNTNDGYERGVALTAGGRVLRDEAERLAVCRLANDYFRHDMHWLLGHYRMAIRSTINGPVEEASPLGQPAMRLDVTWETGLTPHDEYRIWIDPTSHRAVAWSFPEGIDKHATFTWEDWQQVGPGHFSLKHRELDGDHEYLIERLRVETDPGARRP